MQQTTPVTPIAIWDAINGFQLTNIIKTGIELDLFTKIAEGKSDTKSLAESCDASEEGVKRLCNALTVLGFLTKQDENYSLREDAGFFLSRHSPAYLGGTIEFLLSPLITEGYTRLTEAVKKGGTAIENDDSTSPENPVWVKFAHAMMPMMFMPAQIMADKLGFETDRRFKVLDIAASHGIFGITIAQKYPNAEIVALDWANVLEVTKENAEKFGVSDRHRTIAGSAFEVDFGDGYDVVLLTNFLHHFDIPTCETFLRKIHKSMNDGGKILTLEFIPNDDRVSPPVEARFSLTMLANTPSGDAYTFAELEKMFANAGFEKSERYAVSPTPQHLVISTK